MMHGGYWDGGHDWIGLLFMLIFLVTLAVGVVFVVRALSGQSREPQGGVARVSDGPPQPRRSPALELLEQRYASGEIDREEFLARRQDLSG